MDQAKHASQKSKKNEEKNSEERSQSPSKVESLQNRLAQAQEDIRDERRRAEQLSEKLRQFQTELETLPILRAQVEVYQTDFNAEREAREKIAGEKADLLDELQRLKAGGQVQKVRLIVYTLKLVTMRFWRQKILSYKMAPLQN